MRRRLHGRDIRPPQAELRRFVVGLEGMHRGRDRRHARRKAPGPRLQGGSERGRGELVRFPRIPPEERRREPEALRHGRPPRPSRGHIQGFPGVEAPALPGPCPEGHIPGRQDQGQEGDHGRFQSRLLQRLQRRMRRGFLGVRLEVVQTVSEADALPGREAGFDVPVLRVPQAHAQGDLHLQRGGIPERDREEEDEGEDTVQLGGLRADRAGQGLRGLQQERQAGEVHARAERRGKGHDGIQPLIKEKDMRLTDYTNFLQLSPLRKCLLY